MKTVRNLYLKGCLDTCKGWQVYKSFTNQLFNDEIQLDRNFVFINDDTMDINTPEDYEVMKL